MIKLYIFGAGVRGKAILNLINKLEIADVMAFIDNDTKKQSLVEGKKCIGIEEAVNTGIQNELVIVSPINYKDIEKQLKEYHFKNVFCWSKFLPHPGYCVPIIKEEKDYCDATPFNHYQSPYPDIIEIHEKEKILFNRNKKILDIDFNIATQMELISKMKELNLPQWEENAGGGIDTIMIMGGLEKVVQMRLVI